MINNFDEDVENVSGLLNRPTQTSQQLKAIFDKAGKDIKTYINELLIPDIERELAGKIGNNSGIKIEDFSKQLVTINSTTRPNVGVAVLNYPQGFTKQNTTVVNAIPKNNTDIWYHFNLQSNIEIQMADNAIYVHYQSKDENVNVNGTKVEVLLIKNI